MGNMEESKRTDYESIEQFDGATEIFGIISHWASRISFSSDPDHYDFMPHDKIILQYPWGTTITESINGSHQTLEQAVAGVFPSNDLITLFVFCPLNVDESSEDSASSSEESDDEVIDDQTEVPSSPILS